MADWNRASDTWRMSAARHRVRAPIQMTATGTSNRASACSRLAAGTLLASALELTKNQPPDHRAVRMTETSA